jgi:hypothetical protein
MTEQRTITVGQTFRTMTNPDENPAVTARIEELVLRSIVDVIAVGNYVRVDDAKPELMWVSSQEYPIVTDENDEFVMDEDGRFVLDYDRPYMLWMLVAEVPCYEGTVAHA